MSSTGWKIQSGSGQGTEEDPQISLLSSSWHAAYPVPSRYPGSRIWAPAWGPTIPASDSSSPSLLLQKWPSSNTNLTRLLPATVHPASTLCPPHLCQLPGSALSKLVSEFPPALVKFYPLKGARPNCPVIPNNINTFYFSAQNIIPADTPFLMCLSPPTRTSEEVAR